MNKSRPWVKGAIIGGIVGGLFHLVWHLSPVLSPVEGLPLSVLASLLWEWGGTFAAIPRFELFGLHLLVLMAHVSAYAIVGALIALLFREQDSGHRQG